MSNPRRILVVGSGGREHALAWRLSQDVGAANVWVAPGNDGMARAFHRLPIPESDAAGLARACASEAIDLAVVGPEAPLALGVADALRAAGVATFGPSAAAARLESSKWFAKELMREAQVPTAQAEVFDDSARARAALSAFGTPWVIKADGLAAGKGVLVTNDRAEAERFIGQCVSGEAFGDSGRRVVLEQFLEGEEASVMAVSDGESFVLLPAARDYKRALDDDQGPNTGGMGALAPSGLVTPAMEDQIARRIIGPVLERMRARGAPFVGTLYAGLIVGREGPQVVEFNVRFGDPETQVVMPLLEGSLADLLWSAAAGRLDATGVRRSSDVALSVAIAAEGYPESPRLGGRIEGLDTLMAREDPMVFHAGAAWREGAWTVSGGRVAHVAARARTRGEARERVYGALGSLAGAGWRFRSDIGNAHPVTAGA